MDTKDYKALFEQSSALLVVTDRDFSIVVASEAYLKITGTTRESIQSRNIFELFPMNTGDTGRVKKIKASLKRVLKTKKAETLPVARFDLPKTDPDNNELEEKFWKPVYSPITDENGDVKYIIQRFEDVTEQVISRKKLERSNKRYIQMVMKSPFAVAVMQGKDMVVSLANDTSKELWGKGKDIEGKALLNIIPEMKDQPMPELLDKVYSTGIPHHFNEVRARLNYNGQLKDRYFNGVYQPYLEDDETITGVKAIAYDVTEAVVGRKKVEESEHRFRTLIDESPIATALYEGPEHTVKYANDIMLNYWGKDSGSIGKPLIEAVPELKGQRFIPYLNNVYETGETFKGLEEKAELEVNGKLQTFYFNFTYKALRDKNGVIYGIHHTAIDVTDEVITKKELEKSETTLKQLLNTMPQKLSHTDAEGKVIFFNKQWIDETGFSLEKLKNNGWIKTIHPDDFRQIKDEWYNAIISGSSYECECRIFHKELGYRWNLSRAVPINDSNGEIIMWVAGCTDVHEHKMQKETLERAVWERTKELHQANKELLIQNKEKEKQKKELMIANKELESFTYISSHDLQEPLRKIQTFASRIREKENHKLSNRGKDYFERLQRSAERMRVLIDDLLMFSRVNSTDRMLEQISLKIILDEVLDEFREVIESKNITIKSSKLCEVKIVEFQFRQLLKNLISNAIKYSKDDTPLCILINSRTVRGRELNEGNHAFPSGLFSTGKFYCHITIEDNGIGFNSRYSERIFEVFQRLHSRDEYEGTGIGLAIVKKIVENHNGVITAESEPGKGTKFNIVIPVD